MIMQVDISGAWNVCNASVFSLNTCMGGFMKRLIMLLLLAVVTISLPLSVAAGQRVADAEELKSAAVRGFEEILDLWRAGNYGELYNRTLISGKDTRESFSNRMAKAPLKPSCCWEKMQEVSVSVRSPTSVVIRAKLGLDAPGEMAYKTKSFKLNLEDGEWRIARSEILSIAEARKAKGSRKYRATH
jgi:hypothetical protein